MDTMSSLTRDQSQVELVILMTMLASFSLIGTVGNGLVIFVFQRVREKTTAQVSMIFLAIIDLFTCTVIIPLTMYMEYTRFYIDNDALCKTYNFLITSKIPLSAFIMVSIAVDRYFCICHPLKRAINIPRARLIIVGFILVAFIFGVLTSLFHSVHQVVDRIDSQFILGLIGENLTQIIMNVSDTDQQLLEIRKKVAEEVLRRNITVGWNISTSLPRYKESFNLGRCDHSFLYLSKDSLIKYRMTYNFIYPICLVVVITLYLMIYRFMCLRRSKKLKQRLKIYSYVNQNGAVLNGIHDPGVRDDENGCVTELSALSQSPPPKVAKQLSIDNKNISDEEISARTLKDGSLNETGRQYLSPPESNLLKNGLSSSCSTLNTQGHSDNKIVMETVLSASSSCSQIIGDASDVHSCSPSPADSSLLTNAQNTPHSTTRHQQHNNKLRLYKKQESIKRYKNKKRALLNKDKQQRSSSNQSNDYDPDRLREENRRANAKTALMLFTVNIVFIIAFGPAWLMLLGALPHERLLFYIYFIYNAANPFIYAFMNHIFKAYMRNIFSCKRKTLIVVSS